MEFGSLSAIAEALQLFATRKRHTISLMNQVARRAGYALVPVGPGYDVEAYAEFTRASFDKGVFSVHFIAAGAKYVSKARAVADMLTAEGRLKLVATAEAPDQFEGREIPVIILTAIRSDLFTQPLSRATQEALLANARMRSAQRHETHGHGSAIVPLVVTAEKIANPR